MPMNLLPGSVRVTADGVIGPQGEPIRLFSIHVISGGTAGVVLLRNGTTSAGAIYAKVTGVVNDGLTVNFGGGMRFPDGLYYDEDANTTSGTLTFTAEF